MISDQRLHGLYYGKEMKRMEKGWMDRWKWIGAIDFICSR